VTYPKVRKVEIDNKPLNFKRKIIMKLLNFWFLYCTLLGLELVSARETLYELIPSESPVCQSSHPIDDQQVLHWSNLTYFGERPAGSTEGAMMSDINGRIWYTKKINEEELWREYVGGAVLHTFADKRLPGNNFAKLKLILDNGKYIASEIIPNFSNAAEVCSSYLRSTGNNSVLSTLSISDQARVATEAVSSIRPIGFEVAVAAQILIGLGDRHFGNLGFVTNGQGYECANVDYSHAFESSFFSLFLSIFDEDPQAFFTDYAENGEEDGEDSNELEFLLMALSEFSFAYPMSSIDLDQEHLREGFSMVTALSDEQIEIAIQKAYRDLRLVEIKPSVSEIQLVTVILAIKQQLATFMALLSKPNDSDLKCLIYKHLMDTPSLEDGQILNIQMYFDGVDCEEAGLKKIQ
jgi:hypothetical protein